MILRKSKIKINKEPSDKNRLFQFYIDKKNEEEILKGCLENQKKKGGKSEN